MDVNLNCLPDYIHIPLSGGVNAGVIELYGVFQADAVLHYV
jgi:hypothetical protein